MEVNLAIRKAINELVF